VPILITEFHRALRRATLCAFLTLAATFSAPALATDYLAPDTPRLRAQRTRFLAAERALGAGRRATYKRLLAKLIDYPLRPYLVFADLTRHPGRASADRIHAFLDSHRGSALAARLRIRWLKHLARAGRWEAYLTDYRAPTGTELHCHQLHALLATGERERALAAAPALWLVGRSQPPACDPVFAAWRAAGGMTPGRVWKRVSLAIAAGETSLARYLVRSLAEPERQVAGLWLTLRRHPERAERMLRVTATPEHLEPPMVYAVRRLAQHDPERAARLWISLEGRFQFSQSGRAAVGRALLVGHARAGLRAGLDWLARIPESDLDGPARAWGIVLALRLGEWSTALANIDRLGIDRLRDARWRYWGARALERLGRDGEARVLLAALASRRGYYGFLAADRLALPYRFNDRPNQVSATALAEIARRPAMRRAHELLALGRRLDARREWRAAIARMSPSELVQAAGLAHRWGWHGRTILTLARTSRRDDLAARFPLAYREIVAKTARKNGIDPAWVYAVIRQESAFVPDARSPKGALGLMQIMPRTGRQIARALKQAVPSRAQLLDPRTNLRLGGAYLRHLLERFGEHPLLASAAYNAGPRRIANWRPAVATLDADLWLETVPFGETRRYLRRVFAYTIIYEHRLGLRPTRLSERVAPIAPWPEVSR